MYLSTPLCLFLATGFALRSNTQDVCDTPPSTLAEHPTCVKEGIRYIDEKRRLLNRLDKSHGKWGARHPRHRLLDTLHAYLKHHELVSKDVDRWRSMYKNVPKQQRKMLERTIRYTQKLNENDHLLEKNKKVQESIVQNAMRYYGIEQEELDEHIQANEKEGRVPEKISVGQALKHLIRDWSAEGYGEHDDAFPCVINTLLNHSHRNATVPPRVLLPGSGLGRLGHDIHNLGGFEVSLNEYSMYMNVAYRYVESLQNTKRTGLHPFIDGWSHHATTSDMQRRVSFPDHPPARPSVVLVEGDFTTEFKYQEASFDYIVTLFFIDTARNLLAYFDAIHKLLKPGGVWINFGPLLYGSGPFVQLSLDEIVRVIGEWGFEFLEGDESCGSTTFSGGKVRQKTASYAFNPRDLSRNAYMAQFWVVRKSA